MSRSASSHHRQPFQLIDDIKHNCPIGNFRIISVMKARFRLLAALLLGVATVAGGAENSGRRVLAALFQEGGTSHMAIAPDGKRVAYSVAEGDSLRVFVVAVDSPEKKAEFAIGEAGRDAANAAGVGGISTGLDRLPGVRFLQWANSNELVCFAVVNTENGKQVSQISAIDVDQARVRPLISNYDVGYGVPENVKLVSSRSLRVIGFPSDQPNILVVEAWGYNDTPTSAYAVDIMTGKRQLLATAEELGRVIRDGLGRDRIEATAVAERDKGATTADLQRQRFLLKNGGRRRDIDGMLGADSGVKFAQSIDNYLGERSIPLGFDADPEILYFASNAGRDTYGLYAIDLRTKKRTGFALEDEQYDLVDFTREHPEDGLIYDRGHRLLGARVNGPTSHTRWVEPKLAAVQARLNANFPKQGVELIDWDREMHRVVVLVGGTGWPGQYFVYENDGAAEQMIPICEKMPWLPAGMLNRAEPFAFKTSEGVRLTGTVTLPRQPRLKQPPLVVMCPDVPGWRDLGGFDREAQALAFAGFVVLRVDYRGISGMGRAHREAVRTAYDRVPISDLRASINWLAERVPFDRSRIALVGYDYGGYLALRALELYPQDFRTAVTFDAPTDLPAWAIDERAHTVVAPGPVTRYFREETGRNLFGNDRKKLEAISLLSQATIKQPVFVIERPTSPSWPNHGGKLVSLLKAKGVAAEHVTMTANGIKDDGHEMRFSAPEYYGQEFLPSIRMSRTAKAEVYLWVNEFLIAQLYDFEVKVGEEKVVK